MRPIFCPGKVTLVDNTVDVCMNVLAAPTHDSLALAVGGAVIRHKVSLECPACGYIYTWWPPLRRRKRIGLADNTRT